MRMQLRLNILFLFTLVAFQSWAQEDTTKVKLEDITIDFLASYYQQDGNHSPVTGGIGTEELTNIAPAIIVNIPLDSVKSISFNGGVDFYSSASTDNINNPFLDPNHVSGASASDARAYVTVGWKKKNKKTNSERSIYAGLSSEFDVFSLSGGASFLKSSKDNNRSFYAKAMYFFDYWKLIYPVEFRNGEVSYLNTNIRHSFNLSLTGSTNLNKRMSFSVTTDFVAQTGLLSTPFHRVYFQNQELPRIEMLPSSRFKVPVGLRLNYHATDFLIVKTFYRYYWDNWSLTGHTAEITLPIKISQAFRVYPFYRYSSQNGARYFAGFGEHLESEEFFTSDFDLSTLSSHKYGLGISVQPLFGFFRFGGGKKNRVTLVKAMDLRYAYYQRSDGLKAGVISFEMKINISTIN